MFCIDFFFFSFFFSANCVTFWALAYNFWMFDVGSDVFLIVHTLSWPSMHHISPMLKPKFCIDMWRGEEALSTLDSCWTPWKTWGSILCRTIRTGHYYITEWPVQTEVQIHTVFGDIIGNLNSVLKPTRMTTWGGHRGPGPGHQTQL